MKKILALLMVMIVVFVCSGCSGNADGDNGSTKTDSVSITLSADLFEGMSKADIENAAEQNGFLDCTVNEDGSVTYTMSKEKHEEMLQEMKTSMDETINELMTGADKVASFLSIDANEDYSKVDVYVDPTKYSEWDSFYALTFYVSGAYYQSFAGVQADDIDVVVNFIDNETKKVLNTASYKDYMNQ